MPGFGASPATSESTPVIAESRLTEPRVTEPRPSGSGPRGRSPSVCTGAGHRRISALTDPAEGTPTTSARRRHADNRELVDHGAFGLGQELSDLVRCVDNIG